MELERLQKYADLIVVNGINPSNGQNVVLTADVEQSEFAHIVVESCYRHGVRRVFINWTSMPVSRLDALWRDEADLGTLTKWEIEKLRWQSEDLPARIWLDSDDPDGMNGVDQGKLTRAQQRKYPIIKPFREAMENRHQWCIAGVPGKRWACKVFPHLEENAAVEALWNAILAASRADGDPLANWREHNAVIHRRCDYLNHLNLRSLCYHDLNGTDFRVGLMPRGIFCGAAETDLSGRVFNPNIPSEEVFTSPQCGLAEGRLVATKPLSWQGFLIEDFYLDFVGGKVVSAHAARGQQVLEKIINMDSQAAFLGECALIGNNSPINNTGVLFYNTLFDENACCHMALGRGFDCCVRDYASCTHEELIAMGVNDSMIHVDFMIGTPTLAIDGITDGGEVVPLFREGEWVINC